MYEPRTDPRFELESIAREAADELIATIVREAKSPADVPDVIARIVAFMHDQWQHVEWDIEDGYGEDPLETGYDAAIEDR